MDKKQAVEFLREQCVKQNAPAMIEQYIQDAEDLDGESYWERFSDTEALAHDLEMYKYNVAGDTEADCE